MTVNLYAVTVDCRDAANLAGFWAEVLERLVDEGATEDFAAIGLNDPPEQRPHWMFIKVPEGKTAKNRVHCDLVTEDLPGELKRLLDLGATKRAELDEGGTTWVALVDPEGNEFDLVAA